MQLAVSLTADQWLIHFFQRHGDDDEQRAVPAQVFLDGLPDKVVAEILVVLDAVAAAPPPAFSGGGKWEVMHDDMAGFYEVRVPGDGKNHRLFCVLERNADDLGGASIVALDGLSKPRRSPADPKDYRRAIRLRDEFRARRTVLGWFSSPLARVEPVRARAHRRLRSACRSSGSASRH